MRVLNHKVLLPDTSCCLFNGMAACNFLQNFNLDNSFCYLYLQKLKSIKSEQGWICIPCKLCLEENKKEQ